MVAGMAAPVPTFGFEIIDGADQITIRADTVEAASENAAMSQASRRLVPR